MPPPILVAFAGGASGEWQVERINAVIGKALPPVERVAVREGPLAAPPTEAIWVLRGTTSNTRYTNRREVDLLSARQQGLARPDATRAALIPICKSPAWWDLPQDERRALFEERSRHIAIGLDYLPAVARRLHHGRELGEPFDFLTWFEYAPQHAAAFEELVQRLRATAEWRYVDREVDIRLRRK
jgi:chlorite dismutase